MLNELTDSIAKFVQLNKKTNRLCYIANSCNFPIHHEAVIDAANDLTEKL